MDDEKTIPVRTGSAPAAHDADAQKNEESAGGRLRRLKKEYGHLALCFLVPMGLMFLMYLAHKVYPFGEESVLILDLNGQYVYYFEALRRILHGEGSLIYSFWRTLGGEFLGIVAYYLASPLSLLVGIFPKENITEALLTIFLLKTGLCGLTFGIYLHKTQKRNPVAVVIFATMYALTAYAVVQQHNTMWIDNVIFLPLVLLGVENIIRRGKFRLFVVTLSLSVLSNFYIGYMTCIFVAVYFFYYYFSRTPEDRNPLGETNHFPRSLLRIGVYSAIVIAISAVILLPAYYSLTFGKTTFSNPSYDFTQKFDFLDAISKMYFGSYDTVRPEGLPFLYCGMLTFLLFPLYFISPRVRTREKVATALLIVFFFVSFNGSTIDLFWHGMQRPNWLNYRYSYMLCFVFLLMAYKAFDAITEIGYRPILLSGAAIALVLLILQKMEFSNLPDLTAVWASLAFLGLYLLLMRGATFHRPDIRETTSLVLALMVSLEMFCGGLANMIALGADVIYSSRTSYRSFIDRVQPIVDEVKASDNSFYRMEKTVHRKTNDNMSLGMRGLSNSTSTLNASVVGWLQKLGIASKSHWTKYSGSTPALDSLLGIRYLIAEDDEAVSPLYTPYRTDETNKLIAYENPYALSLAYSVSPMITEFDLEDKTQLSPFERMNWLTARMLGETRSINLFRATKVNNIDYRNTEISMVVGHKKYAPEEGRTAKITYYLTAESSEMLYCYFPSDYPREVSMTVNSHPIGNFFGNETFCIKQIGSFEPGTEIKVIVTLEDKDLYLAINQSFFYYLDETVFKDVIDRLDDGQFVIDTFTEDSFSGTIDVAEGQEMVFTTIPYDAGWVVKLDGAEVTKMKMMDTLLAFEAAPGHHTLTLEYRPACITYGVILTLTGLCAFGAAMLLETLRARRAGDPDAAPDPDGGTDGDEAADALPENTEETDDKEPNE